MSNLISTAFLHENYNNMCYIILFLSLLYISAVVWDYIPILLDFINTQLHPSIMYMYLSLFGHQFNPKAFLQHTDLSQRRGMTCWMQWRRLCLRAVSSTSVLRE